MAGLQTLPNDVESLKALILAERAAHAADRDQWQARNARLEAIVRQLRRLQFGRKSEKLDPDQLNFALEDLEAAAASIEAEQERTDEAIKKRRTNERRRNRGHLPEHLPREEIISSRKIRTARAAAVLCMSSAKMSPSVSTAFRQS